jgi:LysM repeat protein
VVDTAYAWLGRKESNGTHRVIIDTYNTYTPRPRGYKMTYNDAWCAAFVSAVGIKLGLSHIIFPECSCNKMIALFKGAGRWQEDDYYIPQIGDIVMYDWDDDNKGDNKNQADHVGIVYSVDGNNMKIIEGNISNAVGFRDLPVDGKFIRGYCLPDYAGAADEATLPTEDKPVSPHDINYIVKKGDTLWNIAKEHLGSGKRYREIMQVNGMISTVLYAGQVLLIPKATTSVPSPAPTTQTAGGEDDMTCTVVLPVLRVGDKGRAVRALQQLLILRGYKLPNHGIDGDFGAETKTVVELFQKDENLTVDAVVGAATWKALVSK